jgi:4-hydroxybenzoate polyprenyltransferase
MYLKRKFLVGNLLIAALTGFVPILVGFYFHQLCVSDSVAETGAFPFNEYGGEHYVLWLSLGLATFAFILNLAREIVKDMEDVEGDKKLSAKTLPIVLG